MNDTQELQATFRSIRASIARLFWATRKLKRSTRKEVRNV
jgi:hypothetical protein